jgi:hypothetical protein
VTARPRLTRLAVLLGLALVAAIVALAAALPGAGPARAATSTDGNPWTYTETDASQQGLVINAAAGANGQPFIVYDHLHQPIGWFNRAGGLYVDGDDVNLLQGDDIYHSWVRLSVTNPVAADCVRTGQLVIGGSATSAGGHIWRCVVGQGWWQIL